MPPWYLQNSKNWVIFSHVEKYCQKKKNCTGPPPLEQFLILWGNIGKKTSFEGPNGKKILWGTKENKKETFLTPKGFFPLVPQRKLFFPLGTKGKQFVQGGEGRCKFFYFFWQFFSTCEKITQFLRFCKYQGGPS